MVRKETVVEGKLDRVELVKLFRETIVLKQLSGMSKRYGARYEICTIL